MSRARIVYVATVHDVATERHWPDMWVPLADAAGDIVACWASIRWPVVVADKVADAWKKSRNDRRVFVGKSNAEILDAVGLRPWSPLEDLT